MSAKILAAMSGGRIIGAVHANEFCEHRAEFPRGFSHLMRGPTFYLIHIELPAREMADEFVRAHAPAAVAGCRAALETVADHLNAAFDRYTSGDLDDGLNPEGEWGDLANIVTDTLDLETSR